MSPKIQARLGCMARCLQTYFQRQSCCMSIRPLRLGHSTPGLHGPQDHAQHVFTKFPVNFFHPLLSLNLCTQASPHTCPTELCMQDNFISSIFRSQIESIPSHTGLLPVLSPSLSCSALSCCRESGSSFCSGVLLCFIQQHNLQN